MEKGAISSVGSEHLVYTEGVGGSNPSLPTIKKASVITEAFFVSLPFLSLTGRNETF
jgi:hypothetical protein